METLLAALLFTSFASASLGPLQGDGPVAVWSETAETTLTLLDGGRCASSAGDTTVIGGEWTDRLSQPYTHAAFVRAIDRTTGVQRWLHRVGSSDRAAAVTVDATASRVFAVTRRQASGARDGSETFIAFDSATGGVLYEHTSTLPAIDPLSSSDVDALLVSNDGTTLYRLDFFGAGSSATALVRAFDASSGAPTWTTSFGGSDPIEYYGYTGRESLQLSPDGTTLYAAVDRFDSVGSQWDCAVVSIAAVDGAQNWTRSFALPNEDERTTVPVVALNSKHVFVGRYKNGLTPSSNRLVKLSAIDGSDVFTEPLETYPFALSLSADGKQLVVGGVASFVFTVGPGIPTEPTLHAFDARTGATQWVKALTSSLGSAGIMRVLHDPNGGLVHALRYQESSAHTIAAYTFDDSNGVEVWSANLGSLGNTIFLGAWLDVVATSPTTALLSCGGTRNYGSGTNPNGSDLRRGYDNASGVLAWEFTEADVSSFHSDAAQRLWVDANQATLLQWNRSPFAPLPRPFLLQRRAASTGSLLSEVVLPELGNPTSTNNPPPSFEPTVSADGAYVAVQRTGTTGTRVVSIFDTATGALVFQRALPQQALVFTAWDPSANRLHYANSTASLSGVVDAETGTLLWELPITGSTTPGGSVALLRLGVHPATGDQVVSFAATGVWPVFYDQRTELRDSLTGATLWSTSLPLDGAAVKRRDHTTRAAFDPADPNDIRTGLAFSADGSRMFISDTFLTGASTVSRLARIDASTGGFLGLAKTVLAPGHDGRTLDVVTSEDGRFVHVLADGRGQVATDPVATLVATFDGTTGALLWQKWLDVNTRARRILSVGRGGRVAVLASLDTDAELATGGILCVLDSESGVELWRHTLTNERADLCDFAALADGAFLLAGSTTVEADDTDAIVVRVQGQKLSQGPSEVSLSSGGTVAFHVDFASALGGGFHVFVGSATGTSPGIPLSGGFTLPLEYDAYSELTLSAANSALFVNSIGVLDASGDTRVAMNVPAGTTSSLVGVTVHHAVLAIDSTTFEVSDVTNAVDLLLVP